MLEPLGHVCHDLAGESNRLSRCVRGVDACRNTVGKTVRVARGNVKRVQDGPAAHLFGE